MEPFRKFSFVMPLQKEATILALDGTESDMLQGVASTTNVDRDEERMSEKALYKMKRDIVMGFVNLFGNHNHEWENSLGSITDAQITPEGQFKVKIKLDDKTTNPKIPMLLNKLKRGIKLGLSVGGQVLKTKEEFDKALGKKITIIDDLELYEVSVVGVPANRETDLSLANQIAKSLKENKEPNTTLGDELDETEKTTFVIHDLRERGGRVIEAIMPDGSRQLIRSKKGDMIKMQKQEGSVVGQGRPLGHNETTIQICPQCNSTDTEVIRYDGSKPISWCHACGVNYSKDLIANLGNLAATEAQPMKSAKQNLMKDLGIRCERCGNVSRTADEAYAHEAEHGNKTIAPEQTVEKPKGETQMVKPKEAEAEARCKEAEGEAEAEAEGGKKPPFKKEDDEEVCPNCGGTGKKKKEAKKGEGGGENPAEAARAGDKPDNTTTPLGSTTEPAKNPAEGAGPLTPKGVSETELRKMVNDAVRTALAESRSVYKAFGESINETPTITEHTLVQKEVRIRNPLQ